MFGRWLSSGTCQHIHSGLDTYNDPINNTVPVYNYIFICMVNSRTFNEGKLCGPIENITYFNTLNGKNKTCSISDGPKL